jgi:hypothetical protein
MSEQLRLAELSFNVRFHQARTSAVESTNRPLRGQQATLSRWLSGFDADSPVSGPNRALPGQERSVGPSNSLL